MKFLFSFTLFLFTTFSPFSNTICSFCFLIVMGDSCVRYYNLILSLSNSFILSFFFFLCLSLPFSFFYSFSFFCSFTLSHISFSIFRSLSFSLSSCLFISPSFYVSFYLFVSSILLVALLFFNLLSSVSLFLRSPFFSSFYLYTILSFHFRNISNYDFSSCTFLK